MPGHRVVADVDLRTTEAGGLTAPVEEGNRSLILNVDEGGERVQLGAIFERIEGSGEPGSSFRTELLFWNEVAAVHVSPGTKFTLSYGGRDVGRGQVIEVVPAW